MVYQIQKLPWQNISPFLDPDPDIRGILCGEGVARFASGTYWSVRLSNKVHITDYISSPLGYQIISPQYHTVCEDMME